MRAIMIVAAAGALFVAAAHASTPRAWTEFRQRVEISCRQAAAAQDVAPASEPLKIRVNPEGSESYGVAMITGPATDHKEMRICIYDKKSGDVEITQPFES